MLPACQPQYNGPGWSAPYLAHCGIGEVFELFYDNTNYCTRLGKGVVYEQAIERIPFQNILIRLV